ncbi:zinc finger protein 227-like [Eurosta solidaginis]|uniref:zinc finger protein 227-like n=1 Tax=Eurosta solidaginis TaxID=178769 RepID=UPI0035314D38
MSMMEAEIDDEVLPNDTYSCPLNSCQPKCTAQNSLRPEIEKALEGRQQAIEVESAQCSTAEHLLKNEQLLDCCENSQGELSEFIKNDPIEDDEENTEYSDTIQAQAECKENLEGKQLKHQGNELECDICGKCFSQKSSLRHHKRLHSGEKPYKCDICEKRFAHVTNITVHMRTHTGEKPYKCKYCETGFGRIDVLHTHLRLHLGVNVHRCKFCPLAFPLASELRLHLTSHENEDAETRERNMTALKEEEAKLKQKILKRKLGSISVPPNAYSKGNIKDQSYFQHSHFLLYADDLKVFTTVSTPSDSKNIQSDLNNVADWCRNNNLPLNIVAKKQIFFFFTYKHIRGKNYQYPCNICGKRFKTKWDLRQHKRIHSDEKPHKCDFCEMRFATPAAVREHLRTHTGEKPYKCKYCDRCLTTKHNLNKHLRVHLGDNIHRCESCPLAFSLASELRLHSTTHKDEDPEKRERNVAALREEEAKLKANR